MEGEGRWRWGGLSGKDRLAAFSWGKGRIEELDVVQRGWCKNMLEVPREFIEREMGMRDCKYRVVRARLTLAKRMIDRGGKARDSIVEGWRVNGKWISELRRS